MALIKCKECGKEISSNASYCIHCGNQIENKKTKVCKECEKENDQDATQCKYCGNPFETKKTKVCTHCGYEISGTDNFCIHCGNQFGTPANNAVGSNSNSTPNGNGNGKVDSLCLSGMIIGIVSFIIDFYGLVSLTGLVLSIVGYNRGDARSKKFALAGIICSGIELLLKSIQLIILISEGY